MTSFIFMKPIDFCKRSQLSETVLGSEELAMSMGRIVGLSCRRSGDGSESIGKDVV